MSVFSSILNFLSNGLQTIFSFKSEKLKKELKDQDIVLTDMQLDFLRDKMQNELKIYMLDNANKIESDFRSFVTEYEGAAKDVGPFVQKLRGSIRPLVTLWAVCILTYWMVGDPDRLAKIAANLNNLPTMLYTIFSIIFGFWFGGRALEHALDKRSTGQVQIEAQKAVSMLEVEKEKTKQKKLLMDVDDDEELPEDDFSEEELIKAGVKVKKTRKRYRQFKRGNGR